MDYHYNGKRDATRPQIRGVINEVQILYLVQYIGGGGDLIEGELNSQY